MMTEDEKDTLVRLIEIVDQMSSGHKPPKVIADEIRTSDNPLLNELSEKLSMLNNQYADGYAFILDLSRGNLNTEVSMQNKFVFPYKQLQSELRYLSWQIQQIADGDYNQRVYFSGDFSYAINKMTRTLRERQEQINKERESANDSNNR